MRISDWSSDVCASDLRRRRCIAGNFEISLLESYQANARPRLLGDVIRALKNDIVVDPIFGMAIPREDLIDHVEEDVLNSEEARINRSNKVTHTVYKDRKSTRLNSSH